jgi:hypothetical protein
MPKVSKNCCVRLPAEFHAELKFYAYKIGVNIQDLIIHLAKQTLITETPLSRIGLCEECGKWSLAKTKMSILGSCEKCGKKEISVF